jgi:hypothetical protein
LFWLPVILNIVLKTGYEIDTTESGPMTEKESWNKNSDAAFRTLLRKSVFKEDAETIKSD